MVNAIKKRVAIIGAGSSGLSAIKESLDEGLEPVCFEKSNDIGGLWRYEEPEEGKEVHSSVYRNTVINTSREMMSFSDFPVPPHWPTFSHNRAIYLYFKMFAMKFNLLPYIRFNSNVISVHPHGRTMDQGAGAAHSGKWDVVVEQNGVTFTDTFDAVFVASGHHWRPKYARFEGLDEFDGIKMHSHYYRDASKFKDKNCLVVGFGNSAVDIAVELSYYASQVYQSTRTNAWVMPRYILGGWAGDKTLNRVMYFFPLFIRNFIFRFILYLIWGDTRRFGFTPKHQPFSAHPTVSGELAARIGTGTVIMKNNIRRFIKPTPGSLHAGIVEFEDGSKAPVDVVILCTGYEIGFPFLDSKSILGLDQSGNNRVDLFKYVWPTKHENIAFLGLVQPWGSIIPLAELQARWASLVFSGRVELPSSADRQRDINAKKQEMASRYLPSPRHTIQVDAGPYMDELATQFGVMPSITRYLLTDPRLWFHLVFGCWNAHQYRLQGPHACSEARDLVLKANASKTYVNWKGFRDEIEAGIAQYDKESRKMMNHGAESGDGHGKSKAARSGMARRHVAKEE